jgi:hypothetical protein
MRPDEESYCPILDGFIIEAELRRDPLFDAN